jgi:hypothetical protein
MPGHNTGGAGEEEAHDEDLGGDRARQERVHLEDLPPGRVDEQLEADHGQRPRQRADEQPRTPPEHVLDHKGRRYVATGRRAWSQWAI